MTLRTTTGAALIAVLPLGAALASEPLLSTEALQARLGDPNLRIIEVSVRPDAYDAGHIPGAVNLRWHTDLVDPVQRDIVSPENFAALASAIGIDPETEIVLYGDNNNWFAAWGAWVFNYYGVENVTLLDGGRKKWEAEGRPLSTEAAVYPASSFAVPEPRPELRARLADVLEVVEAGTPTPIVDIRSKDEYEGKIIAPEGVPELAIRAGHVPGAVNVPWVTAVNEDGTYKSADELRAIYAAVGVDGTEPVIVYCRIGERSAHTWYALHAILGYDVRQYDGSWTEYGNAVGVPIVNLAGSVWGGQ